MSANSPLETYFEAETPRRRIFYRHYRDEAASHRETVLLLHGLGDHSGRHTKVAEMMVSFGFDVIAPDWPGNGNSDGKKGDLPLISEGLSLIEELLRHLAIKPAGIFAHSTGAFYCLQFFRIKPELFSGLRWLVLSSPLLAPSHKQHPGKIWLARKLSAVFPKLRLSTGVKASDCHDTEKATPNLVRAIEGIDKGLHNFITLRAAHELLEKEEGIWDGVAALPNDAALFLLQGSEDRICPPPYAMRLFQDCRVEEKTFALIHDARHEPFHEPHGFSAFSTLRNWLRLRVRQKGREAS